MLQYVLLLDRPDLLHLGGIGWTATDRSLFLSFSDQYASDVSPWMSRVPVIRG